MKRALEIVGELFWMFATTLLVLALGLMALRFVRSRVPATAGVINTVEHAAGLQG